MCGGFAVREWPQRRPLREGGVGEWKGCRRGVAAGRGGWRVGRSAGARREAGDRGPHGPGEARAGPVSGASAGPKV